MAAPSVSIPREAKDTRIRKRQNKVTRPTQAPLGGVSFKRFIYVLAAIVLAYSIYYAYKLSEIQRIKTSNFQDNLKKAQGKPPIVDPNSKEGRKAALQDKIEDLANMLGVQPIVLASAIAGVVKPIIPDASSSSIVSEAKETGSVLSAFTEGLTAATTVEPTATPTPTNGGGGAVAASATSVLQAAGFDDMGMDAD